MRDNGSIINLYAFFELATEVDAMEASESYYRYNRIMRFMSEKTGYPLQVVCAVFSALSPNNDYIGNIRDAKNLLTAHAKGKSIDSFKVSTYNNNKRKAWSVANGVPPLEAIVARKTLSFYENILDPDTSQRVTVDGHMFWSWIGKCGNVTGRRHDKNEKIARVTPKVYDIIERDVQEIARRESLQPHSVQAIIWHSYRSKFNKVKANQYELIPSDFIVAGMA